VQLVSHLSQRVAQTLDRLCSAFDGPIGLGVSGGSDSLALLKLAQDWAAASDRRIVAYTVDHGLRPEAAREAADVERRCAALGVPHRTLRWNPPADRTTQARARRARHALLATAVRTDGGSLLLLGHTEDDQAETVAMRMRAGSGVAGLAGMRNIAPSPVWPEGRGVAVARPLLTERREDLRDELCANGWLWIDDPSNANHEYERVRVRAELEQDDTRRTELLETSSMARAKRAVLDRDLAMWLGNDVECAADSSIRFSPGSLDIEALTEGLAIVLMAAAGSDQRAPYSARRALAKELQAPGWRARTLGGAWIAPRKGEIMVCRDPGEAAKVSTIDPRFEGVWDGRFLISRAGNTRVSNQIWRSGDPATPMARDTMPRGLSSTQIAENLVKARLSMTKYLLEQDALTL